MRMGNLIKTHQFSFYLAQSSQNCVYSDCYERPPALGDHTIQWLFYTGFLVLDKHPHPLWPHEGEQTGVFCELTDWSNFYHSAVETPHDMVIYKAIFYIAWQWQVQDTDHTTNSQRTPHTMWRRYNVVNFLQNSCKRHTIARPLGRGMVCLL